jgi:hypothetical protein
MLRNPADDAPGNQKTPAQTIKVPSGVPKAGYGQNALPFGCGRIPPIADETMNDTTAAKASTRSIRARSSRSRATASSGEASAKWTKGWWVCTTSDERGEGRVKME